MRTYSYPNCCGGFVLGDFGGTEITMGKAFNVDDDFEGKVKRYLEERAGEYGFVTLTINEDQREVYGEKIIKLGFVLSFACEGNHRSNVYHYHKVLREPLE